MHIFKMKPPAAGTAIAVDSDRDALAVIRRMRLQPSSRSLNVDSFNQLIVAAKDDVVKATAAAKDELQYYRKILDIDNTHRRPPQSQQPELKPLTKLPSLAAPPAVKLPQVLVTSNQQERPLTREKKAKPKAAPRQLQELPPPTEKPRPRPQAQTQAVVKAKAATKQDKKTKVTTPPSNQQVHVKTQPPPSKTPSSSSSSSKQSKLDCVASFDDDEPELDMAPVWNDHEFTSGYGSDDNM
ncbi:hypothetical protein LEN26_011409 [Aphanomyces euteiches]|nr:hypothetical protein LEN26_011409 [Aphanomyces euteiches]